MAIHRIGRTDSMQPTSRSGADTCWRAAAAHGVPRLRPIFRYTPPSTPPRRCRGKHKLVDMCGRNDLVEVRGCLVRDMQCRREPSCRTCGNRWTDSSARSSASADELPDMRELENDLPGRGPRRFCEQTLQTSRW
ncbi:hypothetical protein H310_11804 [Aphanomyces invadans]|uniref:Uncharacterized protein n=1 Tax=Aphanomyces invadans TaxID=157072 RepID=A0A024TKH1_9STRA|nr:hypothetical protein H310_11804 [Aphanomyces invadans]ETV94484.1 hypothetical protein H310_11804 [Aphanomyces invadans]|eukprot:XP_008876799.1 hypothetical protein H310_11804 [Aphanomyces invadans]